MDGEGWMEEGGWRRIVRGGWLEEGGWRRVVGRGWLEEGGWRSFVVYSVSVMSMQTATSPNEAANRPR